MALDIGHQNLVIGVGAKRAGGREMNDKSNIAPVATMTVQRQTHVSQYGIGSALGYLIHSSWHIDESGDGAPQRCRDP